MNSEEASNLFGQISAEKALGSGDNIFQVGIKPIRVARRGNAAIDYAIEIKLGPSGYSGSWHDLFANLGDKCSHVSVRPIDNGIILS